MTLERLGEIPIQAERPKIKKKIVIKPRIELRTLVRDSSRFRLKQNSQKIKIKIKIVIKLRIELRTLSVNLVKDT